MPEAKSALLFTYSSEPPKKPPIIKQSCGIGDTDGFPAFDVDSDTYASKDDSKWGFLITGGAEFHMPLTVFQVTPDGLADKGGIRLGDIILEINEEDSTQLTLAQAHEKIDAASKKIFFVVKSMMDDEDNLDGYEQSDEEKTIVLRVPKPMPPLKEFTPTPLLGSRCWHPIMWQDPPEPPKPKKKKTKVEIDEEGNEVVIELSEDESSDEEEEELPHHRIVRNIRRFFAEVGENHELKNRTIEDMLLALPTAASIEARLREMQRKLSEIAEIPKILSSTLATVSQTFDKLMPASAAHQQQHTEDAYRKYSYDEDVMDYELNADENDTDSDVAVPFRDEKKAKTMKKKKQQQVESDDKLTTMMKKKKVKDCTPESDYASEANYKGNEADDDDEDDDEDGNDFEEYEQQSQAATLEEDGDVENGTDVEDDEDDDDDFLSTTYTWNLRNVPKLQLNDEKNEVDTDEDDVIDDDEDNDTDDADDNFNGIKMQRQKLKCNNEGKVRLKMHTPEQLFKHEKQEKLDKLERSWPWADREKIIYKQSTCHLVRRKPLGLVEQRIQLLAKQNLFDNLQKLDRQK